MNEQPLVYFVGAGPGDPDLLTVRALKLLRQADIVLYDALVGDAVLDLIPSHARKLPVGKRAGRNSRAQNDINQMLVRLARPGRKLVRLKGGDPGMFGRLAEETLALDDAGIGFEIVPGVTTAAAAAAASGVPLSLRGEARRVQFVTAHARQGDHLDLDWHSLADENATTVFYMARRSARTIAANLISHGLSSATPVLVISDVSRDSEMRRRTLLEDLPETVRAFPPEVPLIILVGKAVANARTIPAFATAFI